MRGDMTQLVYIPDPLAAERTRRKARRAFSGRAMQNLNKEALLDAEVKPSAENASFLRVVWFRPPFEHEPRAVLVDLRKLHAA